MFGAFLSVMLSVGARDWDTRQKQAKAKAELAQGEYEAGIISKEEAVKKLQALQSGGKYNRVDLGNVTEAVGNRELRQELDPLIAQQRESKSYKTPAAQFDDDNPNTGLITERQERERQIAEQTTPLRQKEILVRQQGQQLWSTRRSLNPNEIDRLNREYTIPSREERRVSYITGEIPRRTAQVKRYDELTEEEKRLTKPKQELPSAELGLIKRTGSIVKSKPDSFLSRFLKDTKRKYKKVKESPKGSFIKGVEYPLKVSKSVFYDMPSTFTAKFVKPTAAKGVDLLEKPSQSKSKIISIPSKLTRGFLKETKEKPKRVYGYTMLGAGLTAASGSSAALKVTSTLAKTGKIGAAAGTITQGSLLGAYGAGVTIKAITAPSGQKIETIGRGVQPLVFMGIGSKIYTSVKSSVLSSEVKYKSPNQVRDIIKRKDFKLAKSSRELSKNVRVRVRELRGFKATRGVSIENGRVKVKGTYQPKLSKEKLISPKELIQPDAMTVRVYSQRLGKVTAPKVKTVTGKELSKPMTQFYNIDKTSKGFISYKNLPKLAQKAVLKTDITTSARGTYKELGFARGYFEPLDFSKSTSLVTTPKPNYAKPPPQTFTKIPDLSQAKIKYVYKLPRFTGVIPRITESGVAIGSEKYIGGKYVGFLSAGKARIKKVNPFKWIKPLKEKAVIGVGKEVVSKTGGVQIVTGVKLKTPQQAKTAQTVTSLFAGQKTKQAQRQEKVKVKKTKAKNVQKQYYKVVQKGEPTLKPTVSLSSTKPSKLGLLFGSASISSSKLNSLFGLSSNQSKVSRLARVSGKSMAKISKQDLVNIQATDSLSISDTAQDVRQIQRGKNIFKPIGIPTTPTTRTPPKPRIPILPFGSPEELFNRRKPRLFPKFPIAPKYKPSVLGIDVFKETGRAISKAPKAVTGLGLRLPTAKMVGAKPKSKKRKKRGKKKKTKRGR